MWISHTICEPERGVVYECYRQIDENTHAVECLVFDGSGWTTPDGQVQRPDVKFYRVSDLGEEEAAAEEARLFEAIHSLELDARGPDVPTLTMEDEQMTDWKKIADIIDEIKTYFETVPEEQYDTYIWALSAVLESIREMLTEEDDGK